MAFVGAGGKTTCMFRLAEELKKLGAKVVVTTTTKIWYPKAFQYDRLIIHPEAEEVLAQVASAAPGTITVVAEEVLGASGKLKGFAPEIYDRLLCAGLVDYILVEADGSKSKPVKAPGEHEPVLPKRTELVIGLTGFDCYSRTIDRETVFRMDEFCNVTKKSAGEKIDTEALLSLLSSKTGLFKAAPTNARKVWILNKVDESKTLAIAEQVGRYIFSQVSGIDTIVLSALNQKEPIKKSFFRQIHCLAGMQAHGIRQGRD